MSKRFNGGGVIHERMVVTMSVSSWYSPLSVRKECAVKFVLNWTFAIKLPLGSLDDCNDTRLGRNISGSTPIVTQCCLLY